MSLEFFLLVTVTVNQILNKFLSKNQHLLLFLIS